MNSILRQFAGREHTPLIQFIKYGLCGCAAVGVHSTVFFVCAWLFLPALQASDPLPRLLGVTPPLVLESQRAWHAAVDNGVAFLFSNLTAYILNVLWVFESGRHKRWVELLLFYAVSGISMVIGTVLQSMLIAQWGMATTPAFGANVVTAIVINYAMRKFVIFKG